MNTLIDIAPELGVRATCAAFGVPRASYYRERARILASCVRRGTVKRGRVRDITADERVVRERAPRPPGPVERLDVTPSRMRHAAGETIFDGDFARVALPQTREMLLHGDHFD